MTVGQRRKGTLTADYVHGDLNDKEQIIEESHTDLHMSYMRTCVLFNVVIVLCWAHLASCACGRRNRLTSQSTSQ